MTLSSPRSAPPPPPSRSAPQGQHPRPLLGFLRRNPQQPARARPELAGSVAGIAQVTMAWRRRRRQEGAGLDLLKKEEEEGCTLPPALLFSRRRGMSGLLLGRPIDPARAQARPRRPTAAAECSSPCREDLN